MLVNGKTEDFTGTIVASEKYELVLFVADGGDYDLDKTENGVVIDPCAILKAESAPINPTPKTGSGSGGCSAGVGALALLALVPLFLRRKM